MRAYTWVYLIFLYAPIVLLPLFAFNDSTTIAFPLQGFTTKWFAQLPTIPALTSSVWASVKIASITAFLSTILGVCAARAAVRYRFIGKRPIIGLIMLPLVLPEIIVAVSLLVVFLQLGLSIGSWSVIAGHTLICMPFAISILNSSFQNIDPALEETSLDLGETRLSTFCRVTLPLIWPGLIASLLISFTISLDEFIIAFFLSSTEPTLPVYLWSQLRFPTKLPVVMALGTLLVCLSILLLALAETLRRRGLRKTGQSTEGRFL